MSDLARQTLKKLKETAGELNDSHFSTLAQQLANGKWVQFTGQHFVDHEGTVINCTPADIVGTEWLRDGESFKAFHQRKAAPAAPATEAAPAAPAPAAEDAPAVMVAIADMGLSPVLVSRLKDAGITELGVNDDLSDLDLPPAMLAQLKVALSKQPIK